MRKRQAAARQKQRSKPPPPPPPEDEDDGPAPPKIDNTAFYEKLAAEADDNYGQVSSDTFLCTRQAGHPVCKNIILRCFFMLLIAQLPENILLISCCFVLWNPGSL